MILEPGLVISVTAEKPAAGGRMLARHEGLVVLVSGTIPGETVRARIDRVDRSLAWASAVEIVNPHPARRAVGWDVRCSAAAYAHMAYDTQLSLKGELIRDALVRIGRHPWPGAIEVAASPETGYRMRCRVHARGHQPGFFLEGTHTVCDPAQTGQLLPGTVQAIRALGDVLIAEGRADWADVEVSENIAADQRAMHVHFESAAPGGGFAAGHSIQGVSGLSWSDRRRAGDLVAYGDPWVEERLEVDGATVRLRRHVRAFFQANRHLLPSLVTRVRERCADSPVVDLYAGAGLFAVTVAAGGRHQVVAVEGDEVAAADLAVNAGQSGGRVETRAMPVERFVASPRLPRVGTLVLDPPRTGMTRAAADGAVRLGAARVAFVSCDVATFARDVRRFVDGGYRLVSVEGFDLFPNTPHVEVLAVMDRT